VDGAPVRAEIAGLLRGLVADGVVLREGVKLGDIDPRGREVDPAVVSDKARAVAAGVLEAAVLGTRRL
jgi:xanthine dehydrogenase accessory factor